MKQKLFTLFFSILIQTIFAQNLEFSAQFYSESYGQKMISMSDGNWFFAGKIYPGLWENKEFTVIYGAIDQEGNLFPFSPIEDYDNSNALQLFQKNNGNILIGAENFECGQFSNGIVYEVNDQGEVLVSYDLGMECQGFLDIKSYQDNIFTGCAGGIAQLLDDGAITSIATNIGNVTAFIPLYNNEFLVGVKDIPYGSFEIKKLSAPNQTLVTLNISGGGIIKQMEGLTFDKNVVLQGQHIYLINDNLTILKEVSVAGVSIDFISLDFDDDEIWVLGKDDNNNILVYGFNHDLILIEQFSVPAMGLEALDLALKGDEIALVGTGHSGMYLDTLAGNQGSFVAGKNFWLKSFEKNGMGNFSSADVSLDMVNTNNPEFIHTEYSCDGINIEAGKQALIENIALKITNHGIDSLDRVVANVHVVGCPSSCNYEEETLIKQVYQGLNLAPGASVWVSFPEFEGIFHEQDVPQLCVWLSTPNQKIDQNPANNIYCKYFSNITKTTEIHSTIGFSVFPNPANNVVNIQFEKEQCVDNKLSMFNSLGKFLFDEPMEKGKSEISLSTESLPKGVYFLQASNVNGVSSFTKLILN